jgi:hypothetical protein
MKRRSLDARSEGQLGYSLFNNRLRRNHFGIAELRWVARYKQNRPNEQDWPADFFNILLGRNHAVNS